MSALPKQVDYARNLSHAVRYRNLAVPLANNASGTYVASNVSQLMQWKIPANVVINLARSTISYTVTMKGAGAAQYNYIVDDCFQIAQSLSMVTAQGIPLAEINDCARYTRIVDKYYTRHEEFISRENTDFSYPCRTLATSNLIVPVTLLANTYDYAAGARVTAFVDYLEPRYFKNSTAVNTILAVTKHQCLGDLRNTLFAQDKDLYFGDGVYLNLQTAPVDTFAFSATGILSLSATAPVPLAPDNVTVSNIILNLAVEDNLLLSQSVMAKFRSGGIQVRTDFLSSVRNVLNSSTSNVSIQIPQNPHAKLKRIINSVYASAGTLGSAVDCQNINGEKIETYQTIMDAQPLQNTTLTCLMSNGSFLGNTDWRENQRFAKGSVIQGIPMYQYNWAHIDEFSGDDAIQSGPEATQNDDNGLTLDVARTYQLNMTTPRATNANSYAQYSFMVISKNLLLSEAGIAFV